MWSISLFLCSLIYYIFMCYNFILCVVVYHIISFWCGLSHCFHVMWSITFLYHMIALIIFLCNVNFFIILMWYNLSDVSLHPHIYELVCAIILRCLISFAAIIFLQDAWETYNSEAGSSNHKDHSAARSYEVTLSVT